MYPNFVDVLLLLTGLLLLRSATQARCWQYCCCTLLALCCLEGIIGAGISLTPLALQHTGSRTSWLYYYFRTDTQYLGLPDVSSSGFMRPCTQGFVPSLANSFLAWIRLGSISLIPSQFQYQEVAC